MLRGNETSRPASQSAGFAVVELAKVPWLDETPIVYWGDLDSNGFAILDALRSFAPHAQSIMMDEATLHRHFDLCVDEPKPATGAFHRLTPAERDTLQLLAQGDSSRAIAHVRLEQERIEWAWARERLAETVAGLAPSKAERVGRNGLPTHCGAILYLSALQ